MAHRVEVPAARAAVPEVAPVPLAPADRAHQAAGRPAAMGARIRELRTSLGLSVRQMAAQAGLSAAMISQVERGLNDPSLESVRRIAQVLNVPLFDLFRGAAEHEIVVARSDERPEIATVQRDWTVRRLGPANPVIELLEGTLGRGAVSSEQPRSHPASEVILVLAGKLDLQVDGVTYHLDKGDSSSFSSRLPHRYVNPTRGTARFLMAISPPSY